MKKFSHQTRKENIKKLKEQPFDILIVGGGLTAVDTATEALAYYAFQVEKFLRHTEESGGLSPTLSNEEREIAQEFLNHGHALRQGKDGHRTRADRRGARVALDLRRGSPPAGVRGGGAEPLPARLLGHRTAAGRAAAGAGAGFADQH